MQIVHHEFQERSNTQNEYDMPTFALSVAFNRFANTYITHGVNICSFHTFSSLQN